MTGHELRAWRAKMDMTQEDLAAALRTTPTTIARWERGESRIPGHLELALEALEGRAEDAASVDDLREAFGRSPPGMPQDAKPGA